MHGGADAEKGSASPALGKGGEVLRYFKIDIMFVIVNLKMLFS